MSRPWKAMRPARAGRSPMIVSIVVVLPAPFRPTRQTASASPTVSETSRRTWAGPRCVLTRSSWSTGRSQEGRGDLLVRADLVRRALGEDRPLVHHHDPVGIL